MIRKIVQRFQCSTVIEIVIDFLGFAQGSLGPMSVSEIFTNPAFLRGLFAENHRPIAWLSSALHLRTAAEAIFRDQKPLADAIVEVGQGRVASAVLPWPAYRPAEMLYAYALECLLKGLLVAKTPALISDRQLARALATHDLERLAAKLALPVPEPEKRVLRHLKILATWRGRYPIPARAEDVVTLSEQGLPDELRWDQDHDHIRSLFRTWEGELRKFVEGI